MDGFHIHHFFSLLLVILLWVPSGLCKENSEDSHNNQYNSLPSRDIEPILPKQCSGGQNAWWQVLEFNQSDPCQVHQTLINQGIATTCCVSPTKFIALAAPVIYNPITLQRLALPALKFQWKQFQMKPQQ
ncbi:hypothetical protein M422DRAFT_263172 [Sphaerobolus stellatus SS14]|uniref:Hydrophobin n=1 Tax=Sphaerobolus stellatus (strain SS14) TaxID=990650 RepID=A0A0C9VAU8_SPHS4|nr:hypothetical protein M422DRAFT_263172 [Sphaerobolus stellatus SS14]